MTASSIITIALVCTMIIVAMACWLLLKENHRQLSVSPATNQTQEELLDQVLCTVDRVMSEGGPLLLAGEGTDRLPVKIPVNVALHFAQTKKCLLLDFDTHRNAITRAFDLSHKGPYPQRTGIPRLWVWPCYPLQKISATDLGEAMSDFEVAVFAAPNLELLREKPEIIRLCRKCLLFSGDQITLLAASDIISKVRQRPLKSRKHSA